MYLDYHLKYFHGLQNTTLKNHHTIEEYKQYFKKMWTLCKQHGIRITAHPGPFNVLVSPRDNVVKNTITDLEIHGKIFDMLGLSRTPYNKLNIHCNGVYGDKKCYG